MTDTEKHAKLGPEPRFGKDSEDFPEETPKASLDKARDARRENRKKLARDRHEAISKIKAAIPGDGSDGAGGAPGTSGGIYGDTDAQINQTFAAGRALVLGGDDPRDEALKEKPLSEETIFTGLIFNVSRLGVQLPNGHYAERDVVRHPGAVAVIALTEDRRICLVRQYRVGLDRVTVEIPAGKLDPGEDPLQAAARELLEETGMQAGRLAYLTSIASSVGFTDELIHLYMATDLLFVGENPDDDEFLGVDYVDIEALIDAVLDGKIEDGKTVVGALICDAVLRRLEADTAEHTEQ